MRVKVVKEFIDKHNKTLHEKNENLEISKERYEEINSTSFGALVEEIKDGEIDDIALKKMNKESLVKYAKEVKGIKLNMKMSRKEMEELDAQYSTENDLVDSLNNDLDNCLSKD